MSPMIRWMVPALAWWGPVLAQDWGLTQSQTLTAGGAKGWCYTLSPRGEEARALWEGLSLQYRDLLEAYVRAMMEQRAYPSSTGISSGRGIG
jgi:hypothetical protein